MTTYRLKGTSGSVLNQSFPLAGALRFGPGPDCDVTVESDDGDAVLAVVEVRDDGSVLLSAQADGAVSVNGDPVRSLELAGGDELRVGRSRFILQAPGLRPERVLTAEATRERSGAWAWWLAAAVLAAGAAGVAWWQGWIVL
jgi:hypothetical protein